ncbi:MAG: Hsp20/alpha crystallin family protein [Candidatus Micrarchaeota archaeon]
MKTKRKDLVPVGFDPKKDREAPNGPFGGVWGGFLMPSMPGLRGAIKMAEPVIDVFEHGSEVVVTAEIPGTKKEDISIKVEENGLSLQVEKKEQRQERREDARNGGYSFSSSSRFEGYSRFVPFGASVNAKAAKATYKNGVLEVRIPKAVAGKAHGHEVKVE